MTDIIEDATSSEPINTTIEVEKPQGDGVSDIADVSDLAGDILDVAPEVSQHAVDMHDAAESQKADLINEYSQFTDKDGESFTPDKHQTDSEGAPLFNADGKTLKKKRGRKAGSSTPFIKKPLTNGDTQKQSFIGEVSERVHAENNDEKARFTAVMMTNLFIGFGQSVFDGDEWEPKKSNGFDERKHLEDATTEYTKATGLDMPPALALMLAWSSYAVPRLSKEKTREKISSIIETVRPSDDGT